MNRLTRPVGGRMLAGVCAGLALRLEMDPSLVRVGWVVLALMTGIFPFVILYVALAIIIPEAAPWDGVRPVGSPWSSTPSDTWWTSSAPPEGGAPGWTPPGFVDPPTAPPGPGTWSTPGDPAGPPAGSASGPANGPGTRPGDRHDDQTLAILAGVFLVGIGAFFLLRNAFGIDWELIWPAIVVTLGILIVIAGIRPRHPGA